MQKILFVTENFRPAIGGVAISSDRISRALVTMGHRVEVFVLSRDLPSGAAKTEETAEGLRVHRLGRAKSDDFSLQQAMSVPALLFARARKYDDQSLRANSQFPTIHSAGSRFRAKRFEVTSSTDSGFPERSCGSSRPDSEIAATVEWLRAGSGW